MKTLLSNFKIFRNSFGYTQEQLSKLLSVDSVTVAVYEAEKTKPSLPVLLNTASIYGISLDFLLLNEICQYPRNLKLLKLAKELDNEAFSDSRNSIEKVIKALLGKLTSTDNNLKLDSINCPLSKSFHINLKDIRNNKNMTQPQLSEMLNISRSLLAQYELNSFPPAERLVELSNILDISMHALVTGELLNFHFDDGIFGRTILTADSLLSIEDQKVIIHLLEAMINNKT